MKARVYVGLLGALAFGLLAGGDASAQVGDQEKMEKIAACSSAASVRAAAPGAIKILDGLIARKKAHKAVDEKNIDKGTSACLGISQLQAEQCSNEKVGPHEVCRNNDESAIAAAQEQKSDWNEKLTFANEQYSYYNCGSK